MSELLKMDWIEIMDLCYNGLIDYKRSELIELAEQQNKELAENDGSQENIKQGWNRKELQKCIAEQAHSLQNLEIEAA